MDSTVHEPDRPSVPCARCRSRRVKCDRRREGGCKRCEKLSQPCPGYDRPRRFRDEGPRLRKIFPPKKEGTGAGLLSFRLDTPPTAQGSSAVDSCASASASGSTTGTGPGSTSNTSTDPRGRGAQGITSSNTSVSSDAQLDADWDESAFFDIDPDVYWAQEDNSCGYLPPSAFTEDSWLRVMQQSDTSTPLDSTQHLDESLKDLTAANSEERQLQDAFLSRVYVENISPWLDIFDTEKYFGHTIPVKARRSALLKDGIAAVAAKQLGNKGHEGQDAALGDISGGGAGLRELLGSRGISQVDWPYQAACSYDMAVRGLIVSLESMGLTAKRRSGLSSAPEGDPDAIDDVLAAVLILLLYESLDKPDLSASQHMAGAQNLLQAALERRKQTIASPGARNTSGSSQGTVTKGWKASFWVFATFDYIISYTNRRHTRLDFYEASLWQDSGLPMTTVNGEPVPSCLLAPEATRSPEQQSETVACRSLLWIVLKSLNCIAADQSGAGRTSIFWSQIGQHLDNWVRALPDSFEPYAKIMPASYGSPAGQVSTPAQRVGSSAATELPFPKLLYPSPMGATALLLYHFCRLLLLLHGPAPTSQTGADRVRQLRRFTQQVNHHIADLSGIARGTTDSAVQVHSLHPLYQAGLCLESNDQKGALLQFLRHMQQRTGYLTGWRATQLTEEWGWGAHPMAALVS